MSLGERIYTLRTRNNLSQGDLAEKLSVSRQSVSKWENNSAVPDLDKIVKLSEIFEVSIDELVKGTKSPIEIKEIPKESHFPSRKLAGTILFCMSFLIALVFLVLGAGLAGVILAIPFLLCGIICFVFRENTGLWCAWAVYVLLDIFLVYASGISRSSVLLTMIWTYEMNYMRLAIAWGLLIGLIVMIAVTVIRFSKKSFDSSIGVYKKLVISWVSVILLYVISMVWGNSKMNYYVFENFIAVYGVYCWISVLITWFKIIAITIAFIFTVRYIKQKRLYMKE